MPAHPLRSLRAQLGATFLAFFLLVGASALATFLTLRQQAHDAALINLAGRQRMLAQKAAWLALARPEDPELAASIQLFDQTLLALRDGGATLDALGRPVVLPAAPDPELRARLDAAAGAWAAFQARLGEGDAARVQAESDRLLQRLDAVVSAYEARAQARTRYLRAVQSAFLFGALLLALAAYLFTRRGVLRPLSALRQAAGRMAAGRLDEPVQAAGSAELEELGRAFEHMRAELAHGRDLLEARVAQRTGELAAAFELSQEIVAQLDLDSLLRSAAERARALTGADTAYLCLLDPPGARLGLAAASPQPALSPAYYQPAHLGIALQVVGQGRTVSVEKACADCAVARAEPRQSRLAAPLRAGESTLGALCVTGARPFDPDAARALTLLANSAAIAIANARLAEAGRRQAEQAAAQAERDRLAADLHDDLAQTLSFLNLKADRADDLLRAGQAPAAQAELERMRPAIGAAYQQVRAALTGLREPRPAPATANGAEAAFEARLAECLAGFRDASGVPADLVVADRAALRLPAALQTQALHIVREALVNARRHAQAGRVEVRLERAGAEAVFTVQDDGRGFDPDDLAGEHHLGLALMRERARRCGGRVEVWSAPGAGTRVRLALPLAEDAL